MIMMFKGYLYYNDYNIVCLYLYIYLFLYIYRPNTIEDYVHRIGRTGRAGATGVAVSFFTEKNAKMARELVSVLTEAKQEIPPELAVMGGMRNYPGMGGKGKY